MKIWELAPYDCRDGQCYMIHRIPNDHKLGAIAPDHKDIGEAIVEELNELESYNQDIKIYVENVEEANTSLKNIRDRLEEENNILTRKNKDLDEQNDYLLEANEKLSEKDLAEEIAELKKENEKMKKTLKLISEADCIQEEDSVKEILRHVLAGLDTVTYESSMAWNDYCILNDFFKEYYNEHWDND